MDWNPWVLELWALCACSVAFLIMVILLSTFHGKAVFQWNGITLNALVSLLSATMKASLLFSVAECIGQWKWIMFTRRERKLVQFERVDSASRGPMGSLIMCWQKDIPIFLRLAGVATLLSVALDPFSQQLIGLEQVDEFVSSVNGTTITAPRTERHDKLPLQWTTSCKQPFSKEYHWLQMLSGRGLGLRCPTGNCVWEDFDSLGVCHKCTNLTQNLSKVANFDGFFDVLDDDNDAPSRNNRSFAHTLPNGHFLPNANAMACEGLEGSSACRSDSENQNLYSATTFGTGNPEKTNSLADFETLIWSMSMIWNNIQVLESAAEDGDSSPSDDSPQISAIECGLYYCVKSISTKVQNSVIVESTTEFTDFKKVYDSWQPLYSIQDEFEDVDIDAIYSLEYNETVGGIDMSDLELVSTVNDSKPIHSIRQESIDSISMLFQQLFKDSILEEQDYQQLVDELLGKDNSVLFNGVIDSSGARPGFIRSLWFGGYEGFEQAFESLSISMTNDMRLNGLESRSGSMEGLAATPYTRYVVAWAWISLHAVFLFFGYVFSLTTICASIRESPRVPPWKNNSLSVMAISRSHLVGEARCGARTTAEMEKRAEETRIAIG